MQTTSYSNKTVYLKNIDLSYTDFVLKSKHFIIKKILFIAMKFVSTSYLGGTLSFKEIDFSYNKLAMKIKAFIKKTYIYIYCADFLFKPSLLLI